MFNRRQIVARLATIPLALAAHPKLAFPQETLPRLKRLADKRINFGVRVLDNPSWRAAVQADPRLPRSPVQLRQMWSEMTAHRRGRVPPMDQRVAKGLLVRRREECGEERFARFFAALGNPLLRPRDREELDAMMDADVPAFDQAQESEHFILRWTNSSPHPGDNLADPAIVSETAGYLEAAWARYHAVFGRTPYMPPGATKMEVNFWDIGPIAVASPPDGPISFDPVHWQAEPTIRQPTSAHELFHKLQYAFGFRTVYSPTTPFKWFSEGSASWAEVFMWQRVSRSYKINDLFENPDLNLYDAEYSALPFWLFFDTRQRDSDTDNPMVGYLQRYEAVGNEETALGEAIDVDWPPNDVYGQLDHFFALFSRERRSGRWRETKTGGRPYPTILGPDSIALNPGLAMTDIPIASGDTYTNSDHVSGLGSDYYRFLLDANAGGRLLTISVTGAPGGNYSYYQIWEKGGILTTAKFPSAVSGSFSFGETIDLAAADGLVFVVSGRGGGGGYTLTATLS